MIYDKKSKQGSIINKKRIFLCLFAIMMTFSLCACGNDFVGKVDNDIDYSASGDDENSKARVGVSMPTKVVQRWIKDGENIEESLRKAGYIVDLQNADDNVDTQIEQIDQMIDEGCKVLIIGAIDGTKLKDVLSKAKEKQIPVISYDRLIMDSDAVSYYVSFDNNLVGVLQGKYIIDAYDLDNTDKKYNIEFVTGSPDDNNVNFFFGGAMDTLKPYIDNGTLTIRSGQFTKEQCCTKDWLKAEAKSRMINVLSKYYSGTQKLDIAVVSNDTLARGVAEAVSQSNNGKVPLITGQDCEIDSIKSIINGTQAMSIFKDTRTLADKTVEMTEAIINNVEVPVNDTSTYDNGTGPIKSFLCEPVFVDKSNYKEILIDSGYYTEDQLK